MKKKKSKINRKKSRKVNKRKTKKNKNTKNTKRRKQKSQKGGATHADIIRAAAQLDEIVFNRLREVNFLRDGGSSCIHSGTLDGQNVVIKNFPAYKNTSYWRLVGGAWPSRVYDLFYDCINSYKLTMDINFPEFMGDISGITVSRRLNGFIGYGYSDENVIVKSDESGEHREPIGFYIVLDYCGEQDLLDLINSRRYSPDDIIKYGIDICTQLVCLHNHEIVHRDIKLENIMINNGFARLIDWDFSEKTVDSTGELKQWNSSDQKGTVVYAAPETVRLGEDGPSLLSYYRGIGARRDLRPADMFAFGVCLYAMSERRYPWPDNHYGIESMLGGIGPTTRPGSFQDVRFLDMTRTNDGLGTIIGNLLQENPVNRLNAQETLDILLQLSPT